MTTPFGPPASGARGSRAADRRASSSGLIVAFVVGALVSVTLGVYGAVHAPTNYGVSLVGFPGGPAAKSALATGVLILAIVQILSALVMYGRFPGWSPPWIGTVHRWSGRAAMLLSVPIAVHCLYAFGLRFYDTRVVIHSLVGCFLYGAFATKMLVLQRPKSPGWALPLLGGSVFTALVTMWLTSSLFYYSVG